MKSKEIAEVCDNKGLDIIKSSLKELKALKNKDLESYRELSLQLIEKVKNANLTLTYEIQNIGRDLLADFKKEVENKRESGIMCEDEIKRSLEILEAISRIIGANKPQTLIQINNNQNQDSFSIKNHKIEFILNGK